MRNDGKFLKFNLTIIYLTIFDFKRPIKIINKHENDLHHYRR